MAPQSPASRSQRLACFMSRFPLYPPYQVAGRELSDSMERYRHFNTENPYDGLVDDMPEPPEHRPSIVSSPMLRSSTNAGATKALKVPGVQKQSIKASLRDTTSEASASPPAHTPNKKRKRYLRDVDRRSIIQRIDNGEKQADLAREFGVTRAAICHMKRNREEIVSRCKSLLASAKEQTAKDKVAQIVRELTQPSVQLLLTSVRDAATSPQSFHSSADRLMLLLLEEALASAATVSATVCTTAGQMICGLKSTARTVCVAVGEKGWPLVHHIRTIEPLGLIGGIDLVSTKNGPQVDYLDLPRDMTNAMSVLLVSVSSATGESLCASVQALQQSGVALESIQIAVVVTTVDTVDRVTREFPGVRILACAIETPARRSPHTTTLSDFLDRYGDSARELRRAMLIGASAWREPANPRTRTTSNDYERWTDAF